MPKVNVINQTGEVVGEIELSDTLFDVTVNEHAVYTVVKNQLANKRQGTQSTLTRGEVRGGGRKPWRQKGTGRARQGSRTSPQWRGGGNVFALKPRDYSYTTPKKIRRLALKSVLTSKVKDQDLIVLDALSLDAFSTKNAAAVLTAINAQKKAYIVLDEANEQIVRSFKNIPNVDTVVVNSINVYDILRHDSLIMTRKAVEIAEEVFQ
ncbi:MAG: 50S ribosomal protein L4 [Peptoniphilaceae bacterium]|nr:50S ribosomal protein L4 [Peptoniphilaceae bacterium]MCI6659963.1 50S ribosomal protein L4 [Peptoniphilaceae bacterium]MDD7434379.1 50S ribosomal protein L4 [Peptoniphilaceae bacterium]MDY3076371.1 50S ribosomal protein L4 [Peptoniphilaceae bacterium]MDY3987262.1 50S ribosomal protein L4 [Peptoniphilaceae bacterium]